MHNSTAAALSVLLLSFAPRLPADVLPPRYSSAPALTIRNDVLGPGPVGEWDDLQTAGFEVSATLAGPLAALVEYEMQTWRGSGPADASRIDTLGFLLLWSLPSVPLGAFRLDTGIAAGLLFGGDLGGVFLQGGWHSELGIGRSFPQAYDPAFAATPVAALTTRASWESGPWRAVVSAGLGVDWLRGLRTGTGITAGIGSEQSGLSLTVAALVDRASGASPTLMRVSENESGVTVILDCASGYLRSSRQFNLNTGLPDQVGDEPGILGCVPERPVKVHHMERVGSLVEPACRTGKRVTERGGTFPFSLDQLDAPPSQDINCGKDMHRPQRIIRWIAMTRISFAPARLRALMRE